MLLHTLRDARFDNISLDFIYGIPGQSASALEADIEQALLLGPEHMSWYELEAKAGTRFTHGLGEELASQAEAMEGYFELVVERLTGGGLPLVRDGELRARIERRRRDLRSRHNLAYWLGRDYLGVGVGAVSTVTARVGGTRRGSRLHRRAVAGERPARETRALLDEEVRVRERLMLGLRLDEPVRLADVAAAIDADALRRLERLELVETRGVHPAVDAARAASGRRGDRRAAA